MGLSILRQITTSRAFVRLRKILPRQRSMRRTAAILIGIALVWSLGNALASTHWGSTTSAPSLYRVSKTRLAVTVQAQGDLESSQNREVINEVEGQTAILYLKPEGSFARQGELVCELDSSALQESLTSQEITTQQAEDDLTNAVATREVAEMALKEYEGGTYPQQLQDAEIAMKLAESSLAEAASRFEWSSRMVEKGFLPRSQNIADRDLNLNCELALQTAKTRLGVLQTYTQPKTLTELKASIEEARSTELAKRSALLLGQAQQSKLQAQIAKCKLYAPADGLITYVNDDRMRPGSEQPLIEEGALVRERQPIIRMPDVSQMQVIARIDESQIKGIVPGDPARVQVDAFPAQEFEGTVAYVQPVGTPGWRFMPEARLYTVLIPISQTPPGMHPGMTARVNILVSQSENVLAVPLKAVLQFQGKSYVSVASRDGLNRREVQLGASNNEVVEITSGLGEGEEVSLDPLAQMTEEQKNAAFQAGPIIPRADRWSAEAD